MWVQPSIDSRQLDLALSLDLMPITISSGMTTGRIEVLIEQIGVIIVPMTYGWRMDPPAESE